MKIARNNEGKFVKILNSNKNEFNKFTKDFEEEGR